jgi:hypothetical protein
MVGFRVVSLCLVDFRRNKVVVVVAGGWKKVDDKM